jgi:hypothetical protein
MMIGVLLRCMLVMFGGVEGVTVRHLRMMRGFLVVPAFGMLGSFAMVLGSVFVMVGCLVVMLVNVVLAHCFSPGVEFS